MRFGRRFGPPFGRGDWEGWTPPWQQREWSGPRGPWFFGPQGPWGGGRGWSGPSPEQQALWSTAAEVGRLFAIAARGAWDNPERQAQLRALLERSRKELSDLIYGAGQQTSSTGGPSDVERA